MSRILRGFRSFQTIYNFINTQILYEYLRFYKFDESVSLTDFSFSLLAAGVTLEQFWNQTDQEPTLKDYFTTSRTQSSENESKTN